MAKGEQKGNRESKKPKERKDQNNRCSAESKGRYSVLATDVRIKQEEIEANFNPRRLRPDERTLTFVVVGGVIDLSIAD